MNQRCFDLHTELEDYFKQIAVHSRTDIVIATHQARKSLKSYRAFVKLLRACPEAADWKPANYLLRDLGKEFSDMRDTHVRGMLLSELNVNLKSPFLQKLIGKNSNETDNKEKVLLSKPNHFDKLYKKTKESAILIDLFKQSRLNKDCIVESFKVALQKSHTAFSDSRELETEEAFHEWRKRLKDVLNQLKLFRNEEKLIEDEQFSHINTLCEEMGMLNDMAMLKEWIEEYESDPKKEVEATGILRFLEKKIANFQHRLSDSGSHFYEDSDEVMHNLESLIRDEQ